MNLSVAKTLERNVERQQTFYREATTIEILRDDYNGGYRVRRAIWPQDAFEILSGEQLAAFKTLCEAPDFSKFFPVTFVELE